MSDQIEACPQYSTTRRLSGFARKHPVLTVAGVGGAALFGGAELAFGVVIGAGIDAFLRRQRQAAEQEIEPQVEAQPEPQVQPQTEPQTEPQAGAQDETQAEPSEAHRLREKTREVVARAPHVLRERARAVFDAARGRPTAGSERYEREGAESMPEMPPIDQSRHEESRVVQSAD